MKHRSDLKDITGLQFGHWTALQHAGSVNGGDTVWLCRCSCGTEKNVFRGSLVGGRSKSCGCTRPIGSQLTPEKNRAYQKKYQQSIPQYRRKENYRHRFGLTIQAVESMHAQQNGLCKTCATPIRLGGGRNGATVDHDHTTGKVRGILCTPCNKGLGFFRDNPTALRAAAAYLEAAAGS